MIIPPTRTDRHEHPPVARWWRWAGVGYRLRTEGGLTDRLPLRQAVRWHLRPTLEDCSEHSINLQLSSEP